MLPARNEAAEDAFVTELGRRDDTDALIEAIEAAMGDRRPRLAARLVSLLDQHVEIEPGSPLERAQRAARLLLHDREKPEDRSWSELELAWAELRRHRMRRIRRRMRNALNGRNERIGRLDERNKRGRRR